MDAMREALKKRRGKGLTIEIVLGGDEKEIKKDPNEAPSGVPEEEEGYIEDKMPEEGEEYERLMKKESDDFDEEMAGDMTEEEMEMKPRSLTERARQFAAKRLKGK